MLTFTCTSLRQDAGTPTFAEQSRRASAVATSLCGRLLSFLLLCLITQGLAFSQASPQIFFTDLVTGPKSGGENNNGAYVTIYGNNFGTNPTVTVGGGQALVKMPPSAWLWYQKMTIQLGPNAQSGDIVISSSGGSSNGSPFTVNSGTIYFVSTAGNDNNAGTFAAPWRTIIKAVHSTGAGAVIYLMNGVAQTTDDGEGWGAALTLRSEWCQGTAAQPKALIAYPGATATLGNASGANPAFGMRSVDSSAGGGACKGNWVFAGIQFRGGAPFFAAGPSSNWRFIGNDITNNLTGNETPWETSQASYMKCFGNNGHDLNLGTTDRLVQGFYLSTDSNHAEMAWNMISNTKGRAGIQVHSSPIASGTGYAMYDISIHDNVVHDIAEEGIIVDTVDPSKGPVLIYNNLVYNVGKDGNNNGAIYRPMSSDFNTSQGAGTGVVEIFNNTVFNYKSGPAFSGTFEVHVNQNLVDRLRNNIFYDSLGSGYPYITHETASSNNYTSCSNNSTTSACPWLTGSNNIMFGSGLPSFPTLLTGSINENPLFVNLGGLNAHLQAGSPAANGGVNTGQATDLDGWRLPQGFAYPIGAYALPGGSTGTPPVAVTISPTTVSLSAGQQRQFSATVTGSTNTAVTWSLSSPIGTITAAGLYTAPASITTAQNVSVVATSVANTTKSASGVVSLIATVPVAVTVSPATVSLGAGQQRQFSATVTGSTNTAVTWSLSSPIGSISTSGLYTAPATITTAQNVSVIATSVADRTKSSSGVVSLVAVVPVAVTVSPASVSLGAGQQRQFSATVTGSTNTAVTWSLSSPIGSISTSGLYTAPATITTAQTVSAIATSVVDGTKSSSGVITLTPTVAVAVSPASVSLVAGQQRQFSATVTGSTNTAVRWSLSSPIGTISTSGLYTAPATITTAQNVSVIATSVADSTKSSSGVITLSPTVAVAVSPASVSLVAGQQRQFSATVTGSTNTSVRWSLSSPIGTISTSGLYTAPATITTAQNVSVIATSVADGTKSASGVITLSPTVAVAVSPASVSLGAGQQRQFSASVTGSTNTAVRWSLSSPIGTISTSGLYTAPATIATAQTVSAIATSVADGTKSSSGIITLSPTVAVAVSPASVSLVAGQQRQFSATVTGSTNTAVRWSLSSPIGTISTSGLYTAPATIATAQNVSVIATSVADGSKSGSGVITLSPTVAVAVSPASVSLGAGQQRQFSATVTGSTNAAVRWSLSSPIGTISTSGLYTAPATITTAQTVSAIATSVADSSKASSGVITLVPTVAVTVSPASVSLGAGQQRQFTASSNGVLASVTWSMSPAVGSITTTGLYTAPASISGTQIITVQAVSTTSKTVVGTASVTLVPASSPSSSVPPSNGYSVRFQQVSTGLQVNWTAPAGRTRDSIMLTSPGAPDWWYLSSKAVRGTSGTFTVPLPAAVGEYEFRYYLGDKKYSVAAKSEIYANGVSGFSLTPSQTAATSGQSINISFTAPAGRPGGWDGDMISLCLVGTGGDQPATWVYPMGQTSGTLPVSMPAQPGVYEFRYMTPTGYISAAKSAPITVQ